jgi:hypothetical protein
MGQGKGLSESLLQFLEHEGRLPCFSLLFPDQTFDPYGLFFFLHAYGLLLRMSGSNICIPELFCCPAVFSANRQQELLPDGNALREK